MKRLLSSFIMIIMIIMLISPLASADKYSDSKNMFVEGGAQDYFSEYYGYALFPTIGKGGIGIGGAYGKGKVYKQGKYVGNTSMSQITIGFQLGGQAYSQVIFFQDKRNFDEFTAGNFEFGVQATAVALTAGVSAEASTIGANAGVSGGKNNAKTVANPYKGMAVFTIAKGGLMYEASIGGQKFTYESK
jgi:lipid-binding SYLF domain-containing protein